MSSEGWDHAGGGSNKRRAFRDVVNARRKRRSHRARTGLTVRMAGFAELGLSSWLVEQCRQLGLKQPTPVQMGCIPVILEGECGPASSPEGVPFYRSLAHK